MQQRRDYCLSFIISFNVSCKDFKKTINNDILVKTLGDAFISGELGTEAAQVAIKGLIPEYVFEGLETPDEMMDAIYKYFTNG